MSLPSCQNKSSVLFSHTKAQRTQRFFVFVLFVSFDDKMHPVNPVKTSTTLPLCPLCEINLYGNFALTLKKRVPELVGLCHAVSVRFVLPSMM